MVYSAALCRCSLISFFKFGNIGSCSIDVLKYSFGEMYNNKTFIGFDVSLHNSLKCSKIVGLCLSFELF